MVLAILAQLTLVLGAGPRAQPTTAYPTAGAGGATAVPSGSRYAGWEAPRSGVLGVTDTAPVDAAGGEADHATPSEAAAAPEETLGAAALGAVDAAAYAYAPDAALLDQAAAGGVRAPAATVLLADTMDDAYGGVLLRMDASRGSVHAVQGYDAGEYVMRKADPSTVAASIVEVLPGEYADAAVAADVRFAGDTAGRYATLSCRGDAAQVTGYFLDVRPHDGAFRLTRRSLGKPAVALVDWRRSGAVRQGEAANRVELACAGTTVAASLNGVRVAAVQDGLYGRGRMAIAAGAAQSTGLTWEARWDNLVVEAR